MDYQCVGALAFCGDTESIIDERYHATGMGSEIEIDMKVLDVFKKMSGMLRSRPMLYDEYFFSINAKEIERYLSSSVKDLNFRRITETNCSFIGQIRNPITVASFQYMNSKGQYCLGAFDGDKIIGHAVLILPVNKHQQVIIEDAAFIHFCFVSPEYRGHNVYPCMLVELMDRAILQHGISRFAISASIDNTASLRGIAKVGFSDQQRHKCVTWHGITLGKRIRV